MKRLNYLFHTLLQITGYFFYLIPKIRNLKLLLNPKLGWNQVLKSNFNIIRAEVMNYLVLVEQKKFSEYYDHYSFNELDSWKFNHLFFEGKYNYEALKYMPNLANIINYITNLDKSIIHVSLSILEPKTSIHRHYDTNPLKLRYHLPLIIEGNGKCIFIVNDKEWEIKENEDFVFNEFEYHSVKNTLEKARVHLMIDYFHPVIQGENMLNTVRFIAHQIPIVKTTLRNHPNEPKIYSQLLSPTFPGKISELCFYKDYYLVVPRKTLQLQRLVESKDLCILKSLSTEERYFFLNLIVLLHYLNKNNGYVYSMLNTARFNNIFFWANHFNMKYGEVSFLEAGVWKGGCGMLVKSFNFKGTIYLLDSFEGMRDIEHTVDEYDCDKECSTILNTSREYLGSEIITTTLSEVKNNIDKIDGQSNIIYKKGWFEDPDFDWDGIGQLDIIRLDCDYYRPTLICLQKLYSKLRTGGVVIFDEYYLKFMGEAYAVDEFFTKPNLIRIDENSGYLVKTT